jgi:Transglutaminase-like superfamily/Coenzyme PQQ synthesis protein D (PqqD)
MFLPRERWCRRPDALSAARGDSVVILSFRRCTYFSLSGTGAIVWSVLGEPHTAQDLVAFLVNRYGAAAADQITEDVPRVLRDLHERGLIQRSSGAELRPRRSPPTARADAPSSTSCGTRPPSLVRCLSCLTVVSLGLRVFGLFRVVQAIYRWTDVGGVVSSDAILSQEIADRVETARAFGVFRPQCLDKSVCLLWLLRWCRVDATLRLGAVAQPFAAHAWVEVRGVPLGQDQARLRLYAMFPPIDAARIDACS